MREAIGGAMTIQIIVIFMLLINAYLAFSVSYTRAFKMKNQVINIIENSEGYPTNEDVGGCIVDNPEGAICQIVSYINEIGYNGDDFPERDTLCPTGAKGKQFGLCIIPHKKILLETQMPVNRTAVYIILFIHISTSISQLSTTCSRECQTFSEFRVKQIRFIRLG